MAKRTPPASYIYDLLPSPMTADTSNIVYEYIGNPFIITVNIRQNIKIPYISSSDGYDIDWGDNTYEHISHDGSLGHKYELPGKYIIHITGDITNISFDKVEELIEISQWGNLRIHNGSNAFRSCKQLVITAHDVLDLRYTKDLSWMFNDCYSLTADLSLSKWNVGNIANMSYLFSGCMHFNSDLSKWNISNVTNTNGMFMGCYNFCSDLSKWDVSNVTDMLCMFSQCRNFNSNLTHWKVSNVIDMHGMFMDCDNFNSDLSKWDVRNVTNMSRMFLNCDNFNSDLSKWDVQNVVNMSNMFRNCIKFNASIEKWVLSSEIDKTNMFHGCSSKYKK